MKRIITLAIAIWLSATGAHSQVNMGAIQDGHNAANAARHLPSFLGDKFRKVQVTLFNPYIGLGSSFASFGDARDYIQADEISSGMIGNTIDGLNPEDNNINGIVDIALLNVAINLSGSDGRKAATVGFGVNQRVEMNLLFNDALLSLAWKGNKQYADQTINIMPRFNALAFTEYYVAGAYNFAPGGGDLIIKPAIRLSYLSGQASMNMPKENAISLYTHPEGRHLDFGFNYTINASMDADSATLDGSTFNINQESFRSGAGSGFGADIAVRISPSQGLSFNIGIMDIGSIRFDKGVTNMFNHSNYRYEGQEINFARDQTINLDSLASIAKPTYTHEAYSMSLPTKLILTGSMGFGRTNKNQGVYYRHQLTGMYLQGFANYLSSTTMPYVAVGYTRSFNDVLNLGANAGLGGISGGTFGVLASLKLGAFRFGINSNNIIPLVASNAGRGADFGMLLGIAF